MQEKKTELKGEIKSLSGHCGGAEGRRTGAGGLRYHPAGKNAHRGCQGRYCGQIRQLKDVAMTGAAAKQTVVDLKKKNAVLEEEKAELKKKIPSVHEKMEAAAQRSRS